MLRMLSAAALSVLAAPALAGGFSAPLTEAAPVAAPAAAGKSYAYGLVGAAFGGPDYTYLGGMEPVGSNVTAIDLSGPSATLGFGHEFLRRGAWTLAGELDVTAGNIESDLVLGETTPCLTDEDGCTAQVDWLTTARLVLGWSQGRTMPYVTVGLAMGRVSGSADLGACGTDPCSFDSTETGWTAGLGVRHELTDRWALKGEVLHVDLGSPEFTTSGVTADFTFSQVRVGAIYTF